MDEKPEIKNLNGMLILLVEDNISNQKVASRYMEKWGAVVDLAENGIICLEKISAKNYDLILMDLQMPEMDGYTAAREIRKLEDTKFREIPIIALTATALLDTKAKVLASGMTDYVAKPFVPQDLYQMLKQYNKKK